MKIKSLPSLLGFIVMCELAGAIGAVFTVPAINGWYTSLNKPPFTPPNWAFGPVWLALYLLLGTSAYLALSPKKVASRRVAYAAFFVQLMLNVLWSVVFFGFRSPLYGMAVIVVLMISILAMAFVFYRIRRTSVYLLVPYAVWVAVATLLNYYILVLNPVI